MCHRRSRTEGACGLLLDDDGAHELVCPTGGWQDICHTRVRRLTVEQMKENWGCDVKQEWPVSPLVVKSGG